MMVLISLFLLGTAEAAKVPCKLKMPLVHDGCQGDWCAAVGSLVANQDLDLVKDIQSKAVIQKILKGTKIKKVLEFDLEVKRPGIAKIVEKTVTLENETKLKRGTAFELLYDAGQGYHAICVENDVVKVDLRDNVEILEPVKLDEWIKVRLDPKVIGFVRRSEVKTIGVE